MLPQSVKNTLWSYDTDLLSIEKDSILITKNILLYGTLEASKWLLQTYPKSAIYNTLKKQPINDWNKKNILFWENILKT